MAILEDLKLQYRVGGVVQKLIFWNIGIFVLTMLLQLLYTTGVLPFNCYDFLGLHSNFSYFLKTPWTIFTYMFVHAGFLHLLFNMLVLHFTGRIFTTFFTERQLLGVFILGGLFSGAVFLLSYMLLGTASVVVGASGAIMAILLATATYAPEMQVRLMLIGNIKLIWIAITILFLDLVQMPVSNTGGHLAHLGGALFGFLYIKSLKNGTDLSKGISVIQEFFENLFVPKKKAPFKTVYKNTTTTQSSSNNSSNVPTDKTVEQKRIDEILDKISQSGYDSLSKEEKDFLFKVGRK
ncbi:rhomboid family intramembrane serine protease [Flavobacterium sp. U410]|jgi:membrane associated rhomboid family serine protease